MMEELQQSTLSDLKKYLKSSAWAVFPKQGSTSLQDIQILEVTQINKKKADLLNTHCKMLKNLTIKYSPCTNSALTAISQMERLIELDLSLKARPPTDILNKFSRLEKLNVKNLAYSKGLSFLQSVIQCIPQLKAFGCTDKISEQSLTSLKALRYLKQIGFKTAHNSIDQLGIIGLHLPCLKSITLYTCGLQDNHLKTLTQTIEQLQELDIALNEITDQGISYIRKYQQCLRSLIIWGNPISQQGVIFISKTFPLQKFYLREDQLSNKTLQTLPKNLKEFEIHAAENNNENLDADHVSQSISKITQLTKLSISNYCNNRTNMVFSKTLKQLIRVELGYFKQDKLNNSGCFYTSKLKHLKFLNLDFGEYSKKIGYVGVIKILRNSLSLNFLFYHNILNVRQKRNISLLEFGRNMKILL